MSDGLDHDNRPPVVDAMDDPVSAAPRRVAAFELEVQRTTTR